MHHICLSSDMDQWNQVYKAPGSKVAALFSCGLCHGLLVDPVAIPDCCHEFCRTCMVRYCKEGKNCPTCGSFVHSRPLTKLNGKKRTVFRRQETFRCKWNRFFRQHGTRNQANVKAYLNCRRDHTVQALICKLFPSIPKGSPHADKSVPSSDETREDCDSVRADNSADHSYPLLSRPIPTELRVRMSYHPALTDSVWDSWQFNSSLRERIVSAKNRKLEAMCDPTVTLTEWKSFITEAFAVDPEDEKIVILQANVVLKDDQTVYDLLRFTEVHKQVQSPVLELTFIFLPAHSALKDAQILQETVSLLFVKLAVPNHIVGEERKTKRRRTSRTIDAKPQEAGSVHSGDPYEFVAPET